MCEDTLSIDSCHKVFLDVLDKGGQSLCCHQWS